MSKKALHPWRRTWDKEKLEERRKEAAKRTARKAKVRDKHSALESEKPE